ncbi:MAG: hypothetical protein COA92_00565 [Sulfurovum sp.]|nr:MAG: hypothetical protein COA92_00565 [Sulfurovum sp.]
MNLTDAGREIKKELSGDEKVLESVFRLETLYKKYKFIIWAVVIAVILFFIGRAVMQNMHETKLLEANEAFLTLQNKADDAEALALLKEKNPALFELYTYTQAVKKEDIKVLEALSASKNSVISDASKYTQSVLSKKPVDSKLYKEMALLQQAYLAIKKSDVTTAKNKLELIGERSSLFMVASLLKHSIIKAK